MIICISVMNCLEFRLHSHLPCYKLYTCFPILQVFIVVFSVTSFYSCFLCYMFLYSSPVLQISIVVSPVTDFYNCLPCTKLSPHYRFSSSFPLLQVSSIDGIQPLVYWRNSRGQRLTEIAALE